MTFAIIGARIEIDGLHVATLHRPLDYGLRDQLTGWLDFGVSIDPETLKKGREYDADMDNLEARLDEAEGEAREANARARAAEEEAETLREALRALVEEVDARLIVEEMGASFWEAFAAARAQLNA